MQSPFTHPCILCSHFIPQLFTCPGASTLPSAVSLEAAAAASLAKLAESKGLDLPDTFTSFATRAAAASGSDESDRGRTKLLEWELPGIPACAEWLGPGLLVLGDTMAGGRGETEMG